MRMRHDAFLSEELQKVEETLKKVLKTRNKTVEAALLRLTESGGKRLRPAFVILGSTFGDYKSEKAVPSAAAIEIVHMATLVHDDIIDDARLRRGSETLQSALGKDIAVYAGDFLFSRAFILVADLVEPELVKTVAKGMAFICDCEISQNEQRYDTSVTVKQYLRRISGKTAALFAVSLASGAHLAGCPDKLVRKLSVLGHHIGMAFQVVDDLLDFTGEQTSVGKPLFSDAAQGVYTLPVIYALRSKQRQMMLGAIERLPDDKGAMLRQVLMETQSLERTKKIAEKYIDKALKNAEALPETGAKRIIIDIINKQIGRRF